MFFPDQQEWKSSLPEESLVSSLPRNYFVPQFSFNTSIEQRIGQCVESSA